MVHPYMRSNASLASTPDSSSSSSTPSTTAKPILAMLDRLHVLVVGPGLGRDSHMQDTCAIILSAARERGMPVVLDADGLQLATARPELVRGWTECVLTPNVVEFERLAKSVGLDADGKTGDENAGERCGALARALGGVTVVQKGSVDWISNGETTVESAGKGGLKRAGGQGDTLTGCMATLLAYRKAYHDGLWEGKEEGNGMSKAQTLAVAAYGASAITRECSRLAFKERGRSLQAADLTDHVHAAFLNLIGEPTEGLDT